MEVDSDETEKQTRDSFDSDKMFVKPTEDLEASDMDMFDDKPSTTLKRPTPDLHNTSKNTTVQSGVPMDISELPDTTQEKTALKLTNGGHKSDDSVLHQPESPGMIRDTIEIQETQDLLAAIKEPFSKIPEFLTSTEILIEQLSIGVHKITGDQFTNFLRQFKEEMEAIQDSINLMGKIRDKMRLNKPDIFKVPVPAKMTVVHEPKSAEKPLVNGDKVADVSTHEKSPVVQNGSPVGAIEKTSSGVKKTNISGLKDTEPSSNATNGHVSEEEMFSAKKRQTYAAPRSSAVKKAVNAAKESPKEKKGQSDDSASEDDSTAKSAKGSLKIIEKEESDNGEDSLTNVSKPRTKTLGLGRPGSRLAKNKASESEEMDTDVQPSTSSARGSRAAASSVTKKGVAPKGRKAAQSDEAEQSDHSDKEEMGTVKTKVAAMKSIPQKKLSNVEEVLSDSETTTVKKQVASKKSAKGHGEKVNKGSAQRTAKETLNDIQKKNDEEEPSGNSAAKNVAAEKSLEPQAKEVKVSKPRSSKSAAEEKLTTKSRPSVSVAKNLSVKGRGTAKKGAASEISDDERDDKSASASRKESKTDYEFTEDDPVPTTNKRPPRRSQAAERNTKSTDAHTEQPSSKVIQKKAAPRTSKKGDDNNGDASTKETTSEGSKTSKKEADPRKSRISLAVPVAKFPSESNSRQGKRKSESASTEKPKKSPKVDAKSKASKSNDGDVTDIVCCSTTVDPAIITSFEKVADDFGCHFYRDFKEGAQYYVVTLEEASKLPKRTIKLLKAVLSGCWIVASKWLTDSQKNNQLLEPKKYEVKGMVSNGEKGGPARARTSLEDGEQKLFQNCSFFFKGDFKNANMVKEYKELIKLGGGELLAREPTKRSMKKGDGLPHARSDAKIYNCRYFIVQDEPAVSQDLLDHGGVYIMPSWILDCIETYRLNDIDVEENEDEV